MISNHSTLSLLKEYISQQNKLNTILLKLLDSMQDQVQDNEKISNKEEESMYNIDDFSKYNTSDTLYFGSYNSQPIEWFVYNKDSKYIYLLSSNILFHLRFDPISNKWIKSEVRSWLNTSFYNAAFTENDKKYLSYNYLGDRICLPSKSDYDKYLSEFPNVVMGETWLLSDPLK